MGPFDSAKDMRVVIACENSTAAAQACAVLERIGGNCEAKGRLIYSLWNFDLLAVTALRKLAIREAAAADMIVIAAHDRAELPEEVMDWLNHYLALGDYHSKALVALFDLDTQKKGASQGIISQLKQVAEWGRMDFFANGTEVELDGADRGTSAAARQFVTAQGYGRNTDCRVESGGAGAKGRESAN